MKVEIPLQGGLKTAAGSTEPMSARHGNCLSDKKEKCELSAEAASFVLIHTIFKPLLHCDRCTIPQQEHIESTVQCHRNLTRTVEKQHTPHQERMFPSSKKSKFTLAETCPRQQNTLLEEEERTVYHLSGNRSDKQEEKCRAVKSTAERGKNIHRVFHY